jgi:hypothetical protein
MNERHNIIFLDIDGVIVTRETRFRSFVPACMERLGRILEATDSRIVISSSWRNIHSMEQLRRMFAQHGITHRVIDRTGDLDHRGREIQQWLDNNPHLVRNFVVIDDETWQLEAFEASGRMVHTDIEQGLTDADVDRAIQLLGEP